MAPVPGSALPAPHPTGSLRILIVEDNDLISILLEDVLTDLGHTVCATATTEAQAVTAARQHRPDLMLVDAGLREGNGIQAVEEILRSGPVAHVFITGNPRAVQERRPGAIVLKKPFRESDLVRVIDSAAKIATAG